MTAIILKRVDEARNMARFYELDVQLGLFGDISVIRHWSLSERMASLKSIGFPRDFTQTS
ncbi:WGR domain-containing protein [Asticcacaulis sp. MM231]|uniref:WGR domain-containing protein n=1 Tax=Asticcacaulis sp. MM231 TaxID=3157666 RepID=UPI0032D56C53